MENLEVVLNNFKKADLNNFIYKELDLPSLKITSSHFYNNVLDKDISFLEVGNLEEILSPTGTGNILLKEIELGIPLKEVMIVLSFDSLTGDIVLNFPADSLILESRSDNIQRVKKLVNYLIEIKKTYNLPGVIFGYEPAEDEDTMLLKIDNLETNYEKEIEKII